MGRGSETQLQEGENLNSSILRSWSNVKPAFDQRLVPAGICYSRGAVVADQVVGVVEVILTQCEDRTSQPATAHLSGRSPHNLKIRKTKNNL